ncbi:MAG TPA: tetratricopeptide repeat protein [Treponemataceae bacterium]|nr:tetratricopeptide repeat protein [Treponemataceae bacterium]
MRLTHMTGWTAFAAAVTVLFFSCASVEQPPVREEPEAFSRIHFGTELNRLVSDQRHDEALALFDTVPEPDASDPAILRLKLAILTAAGHLDEAVLLADHLEASLPNDTELLYARAMLAGARGDSKGRQQYLNRVIQLKPDHSDALTAAGLDLLARKNYRQAREWLTKAVSANPDNTDALLGLGRAYYMENDLDKAEDTLTLAISRDPEYHLLWAERARVYAENRKRPLALEDIRKAIELNSSIYGHWVDYGNYLMAMGRREASRDAFSEAILLQPEQYLSYIYRAGLNDDLGNTDEAISDYQKVVALYPQYYFAAESLGILLWGKEDWAGSREAFRHALSYNPQNTSYALMYTLCYYREGRADDAKKFMAEYIKTLDRTTTEYFLCRLFVDQAGDADVLNRIMREKNVNDRNRMLFYSAVYYEMFQSVSIAQKYYMEVLSVQVPSFFEYRLSQWAVSRLESAAHEIGTTSLKS